MLRLKSREVDAVTPRVLELLDDMRETMLHANGVGLAGVQVGVLYRIAVIYTEKHGIIELINPAIVRATRNRTGNEGCLSCPGVYGKVKRPHQIVVEFLNRNGAKQSLELLGRDAVCCGHEIDHMDGILFTSRMEG